LQAPVDQRPEPLGSFIAELALCQQAVDALAGVVQSLGAAEFGDLLQGGVDQLRMGGLFAGSVGLRGWLCGECGLLWLVTVWLTLGISLLVCCG
jgi:hypothetical protein